MEFPMKHPGSVMRDRATDEEVFLKYSTTPFTRLKGKIKYITPPWIYDFFKGVAGEAFLCQDATNTTERTQWQSIELKNEFPIKYSTVITGDEVMTSVVRS